MNEGLDVMSDLVDADAERFKETISDCPLQQMTQPSQDTSTMLGPVTVLDSSLQLMPSRVDCKFRSARQRARQTQEVVAHRIASAQVAAYEATIHYLRAQLSGHATEGHAICVDRFHPQMLDGYLRVGVRFVYTLVFFGFIVYIGYAAHKGLQQQHMQLERDNAWKQRECQENFDDNSCDFPGPALREQCAKWERCIADTSDETVDVLAIPGMLADMCNAFGRRLDIWGMACVFGISIVFLIAGAVLLR